MPLTVQLLRTTWEKSWVVSFETFSKISFLSLTLSLVPTTCIIKFGQQWCRWWFVIYRVLSVGPFTFKRYCLLFACLKCINKSESIIWVIRLLIIPGIWAKTCFVLLINSISQHMMSLDPAGWISFKILIAPCQQNNVFFLTISVATNKWH